MQTISDFGVPPLSVGAANGWTLTDMFENVYLAQAGPELYDQLAAHEIPWTDPSVKDALTTMAELVQVRLAARRDERGAADRVPGVGPERVHRPTAKPPW